MSKSVPRIGAAFIVAGIVINEFTIGWLFSRDYTLQQPGKRILAAAIQVCLLLTGLLILRFKNRPAVQRFVSFLAGPAISLATLAVCILIAELFIRLTLTSFPLSLQTLLPEAYRTLAQNSKRDVLPRDYILLIGDSHVEGWGDWLIGADTSKNSPYASHNIIHQLTDRDVLACGFAGAGGLDLVRKTACRFNYLRRTLLYKPEDPKEILVYFYENNDLNDTLRRSRDIYKDQMNDRVFHDPAEYRRFLEEVVIAGDALDRIGRGFRWYDNLISVQMFIQAFRNLTTPKFQPAEDERSLARLKTAPIAQADKPLNKVKIGSQIRFLPRNDVQGPPLSLSPEEIQMTCRLFRQSVEYIRDYFPQSDLRVIYIPSMALTYEFTTHLVSVKDKELGAMKVPLPWVLNRSQFIYETLQQELSLIQVPLVDIREPLKASSREMGFLQGPRDWSHFNQKGYIALGKAVSDKMNPA